MKTDQRFSFPPRWFFDTLRALDCFRAADLAWDARLEQAVALVHKRQRADGLWKNQNRHAGREHFAIEKAGQPNRWNTLRALRVLEWARRQARGPEEVGDLATTAGETRGSS